MLNVPFEENVLLYKAKGWLSYNVYDGILYLLLFFYGDDIVLPKKKKKNG